MILLFSLLSSKYTIKAILIITLIVSSFSSYFMNNYHVVIDNDMLRNAMQTDLHESLDLLSFKMLVYILFLGLIPSWLVYKTKLQTQTFKEASLSKLKTVLLSFLLMAVFLFSFSQFYTSFFREHKPLRYYTNPTYWMYSVGNYIGKTFNSTPVVVKALGLDAHISKSAVPKLVIMVVGEAVRADHFSLNGYEKETNPLLKQEKIINFPKMYACGTSTAYSVPCMFSVLNRHDYSYKKGISNENVLDVLSHTNEVDILWRDNNSDSKGVALRVPYEDYKTPTNNTLCERGECRDEGMLVGLDTYIKERKNRDILIVLHQMGNHGPAYYKRYPKTFEKFTPVCKTNQLEACTSESISNAYDNAILYSDYFLSKTIQLLKKHKDSHETSMVYMSDHGESLGESGLYLHGLPYFMAPDAQTHIASFMWFGDEAKKIDTQKSYSQDNLFHTLLGLFSVETEVYNKQMDILNEHN
ncbi:MAG: sulfatase [uncultured Sulfurovum sp.]|uniref:Sulfatase n=1 Tax=uncultured Sulfurovum sp. TaxID=269237 RepID=A0A6S6RYR7_9BACT|nr:MAG: sulfatase [uncultured Sulfurovum sp.]